VQRGQGDGGTERQEAESGRTHVLLQMVARSRAPQYLGVGQDPVADAAVQKLRGHQIGLVPSQDSGQLLLHLDQP
jgi:type III secretion system FlhB-like substrate exporter